MNTSDDNTAVLVQNFIGPPGPSSDGTGRMVNLANILGPSQLMPRHFWAVLLAGGDGIRLRDLTLRIIGDHRPKRFCPITGSESLLRQTRTRLAPLFSVTGRYSCSLVPMKGITTRNLWTPETQWSLHNLRTGVLRSESSLR